MHKTSWFSEMPFTYILQLKLLWSTVSLDFVPVANSFIQNYPYWTKCIQGNTWWCCWTRGHHMHSKKGSLPTYGQKMDLLNGAMGTIQAICFQNGKAPPDLPTSVTVTFDAYSGPTLHDGSFYHPHPPVMVDCWCPVITSSVWLLTRR